MTQTDIEWWWPSAESFKDLKAMDTEEGFTLEAPSDSEMGAWLDFWSQSDEHREIFEKTFLEFLTQYTNQVLEQNGETEAISDGSETDPVQTEEHFTGELT